MVLSWPLWVAAETGQNWCWHCEKVFQWGSNVSFNIMGNNKLTAETNLLKWIAFFWHIQCNVGESMRSGCECWSHFYFILLLYSCKFPFIGTWAYYKLTVTQNIGILATDGLRSHGPRIRWCSWMLLAILPCITYQSFTAKCRLGPIHNIIPVYSLSVASLVMLLYALQ